MVQSYGRGPSMIPEERFNVERDFLPAKTAMFEQRHLYLFIFGVIVDFPGPIFLYLYDRHTASVYL